MRQNIAAYTPAADRPAEQLVPFVSINREDDGRVVVTVRDASGRMVEADVPPEAWFVMARQIFQTRSRLAAGQMH